MSGYRPWGPPAAPDAEPAPPSTAADGPADAPYRPWQSSPAAAPAPAVGAKEFAAPPGLTAAAPSPAGARGMRLAGALLLWAGGFLVLGGIMGAAWTGGIADFMAQSTESQDPDAIQDARMWQGISLAVAAVAGLPAVVAGVGILNRQPWAFGAAIAAAVLQLFIVPVGTLLGIIVLALVTRCQARWWFQ